MKTLTVIMSLSLILVLFFPSPSFSSAVRCNPKDKKVLLTIKTALGNPYHLASWDPKTDCCDWYCLECHRKTYRVIALTIFDGELSGQIPSAVGDLPYLKTLLFHKLPNFVGTIPQTVTKLTRLKSLEVSSTNISGPIPDFLSQLKNLRSLDLSFNKLTGSIPPSLSELPNLTNLRLDRNRLTGSIPDSFGNFKAKVPSLYLSHNQLTGYVPKSLGFKRFRNLDFSRNKLQGDISFLFGPGKGLWGADFSKNLFEFDLSKVVFPKYLRVLDLNHNKIYGSLPQGLASLNQLQFLNVSYNSLCGKIPVGGELQRFETTEYFNNKCLCGAPLLACK
ncbi:polygalacturonase inhibitor-like [Impatiens glandulifera]|uniref:polygalacturonase inhibitor-like n=1 Tax=Impatiens glandulifera TaxID=253017 RepID=UPI001FB0921B|nr:polygalacturonase inhibitor-like [Impatiens glandulifera]